MRILRYLFYPNPLQATYGSDFIIALLAFSGALIVLAVVLFFWRKHWADTVAKRLSGGWSFASFWFGVLGLILTASRVEGIQFFAMRVLLYVWALWMLLYVFFQFRKFRVRHYQILPSEKTSDSREKYLPGKKKR